ncbi:MAG: acyl-CoA carboxylase subunit epsilon [Kineosporiaceae bacterium]
MNTQKLSDDGTPRPVLKVIRGDATPEEIAVILALVAARGGSGDDPAPVPLSVWTAAHSHRQLQSPQGGRPNGAGSLSWRTSYWPR